MTLEAANTSGRSVLAPRDGFQISQLKEWTGALPTGRRGLSILAVLVVLGTFGAGGVWATTAKIGGAVPASGRVIAAGTNQVIQHLEGGIISDILVREGDAVGAGQTVALLDQTADRSQLHATRVQQAMYSIELNRWRAEAMLADTMSTDLTSFGDAANDARVLDNLASQAAELQASAQSRTRRLEILDTTIATEEEDIYSLEELATSYETQARLVEGELADLNILLEDGLTTRARVLTLERGLAQLKAQAAQAKFTINKSNHNILAAQQEKETLILDAQEEANANISRIQGQLNQLSDVELRLQERLQRATIKAPVDGVVFRVNYKSVGAVLPSGQTFMEIFPEGEALAIETMLPPRDIAEVEVGQTIDVVFASDHRQALTPLSGTVNYVSTDTVVNSETGGTYYIVRSSVDAGQEDRLILPGNTAEVFFKTEPKTLFDYVVEPITRFAFRSFKG